MVLDEPLSFWGGFDPRDGRILQPGHPQSEQLVQGQILAMSRGKGSAGTPAGVAEGIRNGSGPIAVILREVDVNITVGAMVAAALYDTHAPVLEVPEPEFRHLQTGQVLTIAEAGQISFA